MKQKEFDQVLDNTIDRIRDTLYLKGDEYSVDLDRLKNFEQAASLQNCTPEQALIGYVSKHIVSIVDMVERLPDKDYDQKAWDEKIIDTMCYFTLLRALNIVRLTNKDNEPKNFEESLGAKRGADEGEDACRKFYKEFNAGKDREYAEAIADGDVPGLCTGCGETVYPGKLHACSGHLRKLPEVKFGEALPVKCADCHQILYAGKAQFCPERKTSSTKEKHIGTCMECGTMLYDGHKHTCTKPQENKC